MPFCLIADPPVGGKCFGSSLILRPWLRVKADSQGSAAYCKLTQVVSSATKSATQPACGAPEPTRDGIHK